jgi:hypothetical protein
VRHVNRTICGKPLPGAAAGDIALLKNRFPNALETAVSIGCGQGVKEMALLKADVVRHFQLFEIAGQRVEDGKRIAARDGLEDRITWHQETVDFTEIIEVDLVYWNNALHHMLDVKEAVQWSRAVGRYLYVNDFVGPDRMQWSDELLEITSRVRTALPVRLLQRPDGKGLLSHTLTRPDAGALAAEDPTECAESSQIIPEIRRHFPEAQVRPLGGAIYHTALNDVLANFSDEDAPLLTLLLILDDLCVEAGHSEYAVAFSS